MDWIRLSKCQVKQKPCCEEMDSAAEAQYLQQKAQETVDEFLGSPDKEVAKRQLKLTADEVVQLKRLGFRAILCCSFLPTSSNFLTQKTK